LYILAYQTKGSSMTQAREKFMTINHIFPEDDADNLFYRESGVGDVLNIYYKKDNSKRIISSSSFVSEKNWSQYDLFGDLLLKTDLVEDAEELFRTEVLTLFSPDKGIYSFATIKGYDIIPGHLPDTGVLSVGVRMEKSDTALARWLMGRVADAQIEKLQVLADNKEQCDDFQLAVLNYYVNRYKLKK